MNSPTTSPTLVSKLIANPRNQEPWERLYILYAEVLLFLARRRGVPDHDAEDLVANWFLNHLPKCVSDYGRVEQPRPRFRSFAFRSFHRAVTRYWTNKKKHPTCGQDGVEVEDQLGTVPDSEPEAIDQAAEGEIRCILLPRLIEDVRSETAADLWQVFQYRWEHDPPLSHAEIAKRLNISHAAVRQRYSTIMLRLREAAQEHDLKLFRRNS